MSVASSKIRISSAGYHYFNRVSGLNILVEEIPTGETFWHQGPRQISIALNNSCDLHCPFCYAPKFHALLDYEIVCRWIREFDENGTLGVGFGGGEPTLHPRFADLCEFTTSQTSLAVTFTSHGHHLKKSLLSRLEGNVNFIRLSMDGVGETYERFRQKSFQDFSKRVTDVSALAPFGINFVVNEETIDEIEEAIAFAHLHGAREFLLLPEQPVGGRPGIRQPELERLRLWIRSYKGDVRLAVSEAVAESMGIFDPCGFEDGLQSYAHISAAGRLQKTSFSDQGVTIGRAGAISAIRELKMKDK